MRTHVGTAISSRLPRSVRLNYRPDAPLEILYIPTHTDPPTHTLSLIPTPRNACMHACMHTCNTCRFRSTISIVDRAAHAVAVVDSTY